MKEIEYQVYGYWQRSGLGDIGRWPRRRSWRCKILVRRQWYFIPHSRWRYQVCNEATRVSTEPTTVPTSAVFTHVLHLLMYLLRYVRTYCTYYCTRTCTYTYCCPVRTTHWYTRYARTALLIYVRTYLNSMHVVHLLMYVLHVRTVDACAYFGENCQLL